MRRAFLATQNICRSTASRRRRPPPRLYHHPFVSITVTMTSLNTLPKAFFSSNLVTSTNTTPPATVVRTGGCACGTVRYTLTNDPMIVHCCHCTDCQRLTGCAFVLNAWTEEHQLTITQGEEHLRTAQLVGGSGRPHRVTFCERCSTSLYSQYRPPLSIFVRVGTLDDPQSMSPDVHIFTRSKPAWLDLSSVSVPGFAGYYESMVEVWKPASLERFAKLKQEAKRRQTQEQTESSEGLSRL